MKKAVRYSALRLTEEERFFLEDKAKKLGISMNQVIIFAALEALKLKAVKNPVRPDCIQIRLPVEIHAELQKKSEGLNMDITELLKLGLESSFNLGDSK
jgi:hypothetical protein